jgi:SAM-dependent methyltransferase
MTNLAAAERRKYERAWAMPRYRTYSPGEQVLPIFRSLVRKRGTLIDLGCGTGRAGQALFESGFDVTLMDFADNCVEERELPFLKQNLWSRWPDRTWDYGYCCDVMEHIPPEKVEPALEQIFKHCHRVFFSVHFGEDGFGELLGERLHLTIQPFVWWRDLFGEYGTVKDARDLIGMGTFYVVGG